MHEPELYHNSHKGTKGIAGQLIRRHFDKVQWRSEGYKTFMDVGSGPGDLFHQYIYPLIADKFQKFICSDILQEMLTFSKKTYGTSSTEFEYRLFDITTPLGVPPDLRGAVDHLTAIYVLHMIQDFGQSVKNLYDFLRPNGGECFMVFMPRNSAFEAYHCLSKSPKWRDYKEIIERGIPPLFHSEDPKTEFENILMGAGFTHFSVETITDTCSYDSWEDYKNSMRSICVVHKFLPTLALKNEFLDEFVNKMWCLTRKSPSDTNYCIKVQVVAASAKRN